MARIETDPYQSFTEGLSRYGDIECVLVPNFDEGCKKETDYHIEVPEAVLFFCREVRALGGVALIVGGSVRDEIINKKLGKKIKPKDFDIEVYGIKSEDLIRIIRCNYVVKEDRDMVGKSFQVMNIYDEKLDYPINVSLPREDSKVGEGHKGFVSHGRPDFTIKEAAQRRDLTINSAAYDPLTGILYDPFGAVEAVIKKEIVVTDKEKFVEDPLRVMRIMQFVARFPDFTIPQETIDFCRMMVERGDLDHLSENRIRDEMDKVLLKGIKPSLGMKFAFQVGIVQRYWHDFDNLEGLPQNPEHHPELDSWEHTLQVMDAAALIAERENLDDRQRRILILAAMCHDLAKFETFEILQEIDQLSNEVIGNKIITHGHEEKGESYTRNFLQLFSPKDSPNAGYTLEDREAIVALVVNHMKPKYFWKEANEKNKDMRRAVRRYARELAGKNTNWYMLSLLAEADQRGRNGESDDPMEREDVEDLVTWQLWLAEMTSGLEVILDAPKKLINSNMVTRLMPGKKHGSWVGVIINCVYSDEVDMIIKTEEGAAERAKYYMDKLNNIMDEVAGGDEKKRRNMCDIMVKHKDPRVYLVG